MRSGRALAAPAQHPETQQTPATPSASFVPLLDLASRHPQRNEPVLGEATPKHFKMGVCFSSLSW